MQTKKIIMVVSDFPVYSETFILNKFKGLAGKLNISIFSIGRKNHKNLKNFPEFKNRVRYTWPASPAWKPVLLYPFFLLRCFFLNPFGVISYFLKGFRVCGFSIFKNFYLDGELVLLSPDVLHYEFGALAAKKTYLKEILSCKLIVSFRGYDINFSGLEKKDYYKQVWDQADALHFLGDDLWQHAQKRGCPPGKKHVLISPAIDANFFAPANEKQTTVEEPVRILSVGRLEWKKGYEFALQTMCLLKDQKISFEYKIAGEGNYFESVVFCRRQLGLDKEVIFLGKKNSEEIKAELQRADIFVHSAVSEGFCNAVLEAQAMEIPVVTSDADGLQENIQNGVTGFIVPRRNPEAMAEKIINLIQNPELRRNMGEKGRERVLKFFKIEDQIKSFENFYSDILKT